MDGIEVTKDEAQAFQALTQTVGVVTEMFREGHITPQSLRMTAASIREGAVMIEMLADRMEAAG